MRTSLRHFALVILIVACNLSLRAGTPAPTVKPAPNVSLAVATEAVTNPVADPKAVVVVGHARFTVLTPQLIRMEWAADGKFEDHASFVFLNRCLPVPKFEVSYAGHGKAFVIKTAALELRYAILEDDRKFDADNLSVSLNVDGQPVVWHPGLADPENLQGTTRTLDGARGDKTKEPIEPGLISRSGWSLVDDSSVNALEPGFLQRLDQDARRISAANPGTAEFEAQKQHRIDTLKRAERLVAEAGK